MSTLGISQYQTVKVWWERQIRVKIRCRNIGERIKGIFEYYYYDHNYRYILKSITAWQWAN